MSEPTFSADLFRVGLPPALLGLRWSVDLGWAREWLELRASGALQVEAARQPPQLVASTTKGIAVIPVRGVLTQRAGMCSTGCDEIGALVAQAANDPNIGGIMLDIDSPGGSTFGIDELADQVMSARDVKPVLAFANSRADSAAYWLASAASEISATPGGEVGSIGVYMVHQAAAGEGTSIISAGRYKVEAHPYAPLSDEARESLQSRVDHDYARFVARVAAGRRVSEQTVRSGYGEGRALPATKALEEGLIDHVETFGQALGRLAARVAGAPSAAGVAVAANTNLSSEHEAQVRRMRVELERSLIGG